MIANKHTFFIRTGSCLAAAILLLFAAPCIGADDSVISVGGGTLCVDTPRFALCTSAPCTIDESDPNSAICDCVVESGANWGKTPCEERLPQGDALRSFFTPIRAGAPLHLKALVCYNKPQWASCIDAPCTIHPNDPTKATCKCAIATSTPWHTFGGECDPAACNELWSAGRALDKEFQVVLDAFARLGTPGADYPRCGK